ncbi:MAG: beta-propeller domain-containing protein [Candidatus Bathyarchaeota archaeon]|nr:MAG: beta-propeller domain-containing protein [Candidatus Bathyarchaeota archaeon]
MQREIKNKTVAYGIVAVLLAMLLTAGFYYSGFNPVQPGFAQLKTFTSYDELEDFLSQKMEQAKNSGVQSLRFLDGDVAFALEEAKGTSAPGATPEYSTTNIQVAGVDEADMIKTDGEYLYIVSGTNIYIFKAYPSDKATLLSKIELNETYNVQVYVNENKLAVLGSSYQSYDEEERFMPYGYVVETFVRVYDIENRTQPLLTRTVVINGTSSGSRMIDEYVYVVVSQPAVAPNSNETDLEVMLPKISGDHVKEVQPSEILYIDAPDIYYQFTTIIAVNIMNDAQQPTYETFLAGQTAQMYVSLNNMYLVAPNTNMWILRVNNGEPREETLIYRVKLDREEITAEAEGSVPGFVLNQFSMGENAGYFRIATTTWASEGSKNNVYVLNMSLSVTGKLEDLAPGETIYSARFMGDRCYLVTFRKIDPLFVIDLKDPENPRVLGKLKITGYSDYLHPYDENHIIGIGKETVAADQGDFAWYQGVKISLFDVSDVSKPIEIAKYEIGDRGTDSPILRDHKAFLFDKSRNLLVIPVSVAEIDESKYPGGVPPNAYGEFVWQGAYIFHISLEEGLVLRGGVTHLEDSDLTKNGYYYGSPHYVKRSLYIENVLYTISDRRIKMNNLETLQEINELEIP